MRKNLDSWALLAWLQNENPAARQVQSLLNTAETGKIQLGISMINVGEVYYRLMKQRGEDEADDFLADLRRMPLSVFAVPRSLILQAARLKGQHSISYADAFAVATAIREHAALVTGDPELKSLAALRIVRLNWIGRA